MQIIQTAKEFQELRKNIHNKTIGFVPTMGALHKGHRSLLERSRNDNDLSVLSIYVNPKQFNDKNDFTTYPKTFESDLQIAQDAKVDYLFMPSDNCFASEFGLSTKFNTEHPFALLFEGSKRPGHFNGVLDIVSKLLNITRPTNLYLGEKDYQQYFLISQLVEAYYFDTEVIMCPTIREDSFLPFSSRNSKLSLGEKQKAQEFAAIFRDCTASNISQVRNTLENQGFNLEYLDIYDDRILVSIKIGNVRVIDNKNADIY
jgi:pantoate--beta-alanine ligase